MLVSPRLFRRARTATSLPGRVVACEDRTRALEAHVATRIDEMRFELGEIRSMLTAQLEAEADANELVGRMLRATSSRLDRLEETLGVPGGVIPGGERQA
jgi:hypothetical protein